MGRQHGIVPNLRDFKRASDPGFMRWILYGDKCRYALFMEFSPSNLTFAIAHAKLVQSSLSFHDRFNRCRSESLRYSESSRVRCRWRRLSKDPLFWELKRKVSILSCRVDAVESSLYRGARKVEFVCGEGWRYIKTHKNQMPWSPLPRFISRDAVN